MCYLARVYNPLYRNDLRYLSSTVYPNPDSIRRLVLLSNTMREIFSRILFFLLLASRSEFPVSLCLKCHWISRHLENFLLWITARNWNSVAAINTPSTWHARQGGANREPPPLIPALKPVLLDGYAPYPNLHTRPASCMTVGRNGGRRVTGSDGIERHRSESNPSESH